ncbi:MAG TPA: nickel-binding protein [Thermoplasmata archaeon]|nr:nickel-binding protein [Thermoplasmata archaeon]
MPKYVDAHPMGKLTAEQLRAAQKSPKDEFGVTHHDILYNAKENRLYCVLDAPSRDAVEKHHAKIGIKPDFIQEVESTHH